LVAINGAIKAIEKGKHVFIEKPAAKNLEETKLIRDVAQKHNVKVMIAMNQRFRYDARLIKNYIQTSELGDLFYIQTGWLQKIEEKHWKQQIDIAGGGVVMDLGVSLIDSLIDCVYARVFMHASPLNVLKIACGRELAVSLEYFALSVALAECT
jgi:predicted dehydrogenase